MVQKIPYVEIYQYYRVDCDEQVPRHSHFWGRFFAKPNLRLGGGGGAAAAGGGSGSTAAAAAACPRWAAWQQRWQLGGSAATAAAAWQQLLMLTLESHSYAARM
jgi:hypothetical protein